MVCRLGFLCLAAIAGIPLLGQQLRLPAIKPNANALGPAIHSFVMKNANLPPVVQPQKPPAKKSRQYWQSPKKVLIARNSSRVCSIPLVNANPPVEPNDLHMPRIAPRDIDRMPNIVAAPPCTDQPEK